MTVIFQILLLLHFVGWAIVLGGWLVSIKKPRLPGGVFHGAATALVAGALAWIITIPGWAGDISLDAGKMGVKLAVTLAVTALAWIATQESTKERVAKAAGMLMGLLTFANIVIAIFWR